MSSESLPKTKAKPHQRRSLESLTRLLSLNNPDNFLRSLSFGVLGEYRKKGEEEPKVIFKHSFLTALSRCGVHLLPTAVSTVLLVINFGGFFVGAELAGVKNQDGVKIATLQVCAKVQELLIIASVSTFVFHLIRVELVVGDGLPLGFLSSGFSFTRISYFWSPEFIGAAKHSPRSKWRNRAFIAVIVIAGMLGLFAGPAAAVLMIPRIQDWPAGGTVFWMNGTENDFWPDRLQADPELVQSCSQPAQAYARNCPAFGFPSIYDFFVATQHPHFDPFNFIVSDGLASRETVGWLRAINDQWDTWVVSPHVSVGAIQDKLRSTWEQAAYQANYVGGKWYDGRVLGKGGINRFAFARDRTSSVLAQNPAVRAICSTRKEVYWNRTMTNSSSVPVQFPVLSNSSIWQLDPVPKDASVHNRGPTLPYNVAPLLETIVGRPGFNESIVNVQYAGLSAAYGDTSMGVLVAHPSWISEQPNLWAVMGCSIDARWALGTTQINDLYSGATWNAVWDKSDSVVTAAAYVSSDNTFQRMSSPEDRSTRHVTIDEDWFNLMSPKLPTSGLPLSRIYGQTQGLIHHNFSTIEWLFGNLDLVTRLDVQLPDDAYLNAGLAPIFVETMLAVSIADAMARTNLKYADFDGMSVIPSPANSRGLVRHGEPPLVAIVPPANYTERNLYRLEMRQTIKGYGFSVITASDTLAVIVLLVHMVFALSHTIWTLWPWWCWKRKAPGYWDTANAWDNVTDWIALCLTSPLPRSDLLHDVGGGARRMQTMSRMAWISASKELGENGIRRIQLVFRGEGIEQEIRRREAYVEVDKVYA